MEPVLKQILLQNHVPETSYPGLSKHLEQIVAQYGILKAGQYKYIFSDVQLHPSTSTPEEALKLNATYTSNVTCHVSEYHNDRLVNETQHFTLLSVPQLTMPPFRYENIFVVAGKLRYIPSCTAIRFNFPLLLKNKTSSLVEIRSSFCQRPLRSSSTIQIIWTKHQALFTLSFLKAPLPLALLLACLECALPAVAADRFQCYWLSLQAAVQEYTRDSAMVALNAAYGKQADATTAESVIENEILPHLNSSSRPMETKAQYLLQCFRWCIKLDSGLLQPSVMEELVNLRISDCGMLLASLLRLQLLAAFKNGNKNLRRFVSSGQTPILTKLLSSAQITAKVISSVATGTWSPSRKGVSQQLISSSHIAVLSQIRRISSFIGITDGKHLSARMINPSMFGFICAAQSPEGEQCGLVQALASTAVISPGGDATESNLILTTICSEAASGRATIVNCDGHIVSTTLSAEDVIERFLTRRRSFQIDRYMTYYYDRAMEVVVFSVDVGILFRPLWRNVPHLPEVVAQLVGMDPAAIVEEAMLQGALEWISADEQPSLKVAANLKRLQPGDTHAEISSMAIVGVPALLAPYFTHNQGPRLNYFINQIKQIMSTHEHHQNGAPLVHNLWYGQKSMVTTASARALGLDEDPNCCNATFAILPASDNQEDSILVNRAAVERGMFCNSSTRNYDIGISQHEVVEVPRSSDLCHKSAGYHQLDSNGYIKKGSQLRGSDVLVGKTRVIKTVDGESVRKCTSSQALWNDSGTVTHVETVNSELVRVQTMMHRRLSVGDKLSNRSSQKGVVSRLVPPEDLPFSQQTGLPPDIVFSPCGMPSRMTLGFVLEAITGKAAVLQGEVEIDVQDTYTPLSMRKVEQVLMANGFRRDGKEMFISGTTGALIQASIFTGVVSYFKLNHMAASKRYSRSTGQSHRLTRLPVEGRLNGGGLRSGTMELNALVAHGAGAILKERVFTAADAFTTGICRQCGQIAETNVELGYTFCRLCNITGEDNIKQTDLAWTTKLLSHELAALGIRTNFHFPQ